MYPRSAAGRLELVITDSKSTQEFWPIGWPPEKKADKLAPDLFKFIPIDIKNARLLDALAAIGSRLQIPFLFDHNGLARAEIELSRSASRYRRRRRTTNERSIECCLRPS